MIWVDDPVLEVASVAYQGFEPADGDSTTACGSSCSTTTTPMKPVSARGRFIAGAAPDRKPG